MNSSEDLFDDPGGRVSRLERKRKNLSASGLHLLATGDKVSPVGALDENVGQHRGDQFARRVFIEERHRVDGGQLDGQVGAFAFGDQRARWSLEALHARIRVQGQDQNIAERPRFFQ